MTLGRHLPSLTVAPSYLNWVHHFWALHELRVTDKKNKIIIERTEFAECKVVATVLR